MRNIYHYTIWSLKITNKETGLLPPFAKNEEKFIVTLNKELLMLLAQQHFKLDRYNMNTIIKHRSIRFWNEKSILQEQQGRIITHNYGVNTW